METLHQPEDIIAQRYRIIALLGQGGMGTTYEAEDLTNYKRVAIKVVSLQNITDWKILELFEREAKVLAKLNYPGIPKYLDYFHSDTPNDRRFYLVQELVSGKTLANLVNKGWHADENKVKRIAIQVLKIIEYLHQLNPPIIHRDIKPQNIVCRPDGRVFLVDFGAVQDVYRNTISSDRTFVGTLNYMPLEQLRGQASCGSDLYSLGVTLLFLLTHRDPSELPQLGMKIDFRSAIQISNKFAAWLEKMLEPAVEDRFQSASEALKALGSAVGLKHKKPAGTKVVLTRNDSNLMINIPLPATNYKDFRQFLGFLAWSVGFVLAFKGCSNLLLKLSSSGGSGSEVFALVVLIIIAMMLGLMVVIGGIMLILGLAGWAWACIYSSDRIYQIEINRNQQILKRHPSFLWFKIERPEIDLWKPNNNDAPKSSQIETKQQIQKLLEECSQSKYLTPEEEDWIYAEVSDFLATSEW